MMRALRAGLVAAALLLPGAAAAQVESRDGIALQNQILQLRQEMEALRRGMATQPPPAGGGSALGFGTTPPPRPGAQPPQAELVGQLLDRVQRLEEELRQVRGRAEQSENRERVLRERVEKLEGDIDFRLQALEGRQGGAAQPRPAQPAQPTQPAQPAARTPAQALQAGQAALGRRDFPAAEAAAREALASRDGGVQVNGSILLGDALLGRREFRDAFLAFDDARRRNPQGSRAPEAMVGMANALIGQNSNRDACGVLDALRSQNPGLAGPVAERASDARRRAQCR